MLRPLGWLLLLSAFLLLCPQPARGADFTLQPLSGAWAHDKASYEVVQAQAFNGGTANLQANWTNSQGQPFSFTGTFTVAVSPATLTLDGAGNIASGTKLHVDAVLDGKFTTTGFYEDLSYALVIEGNPYSRLDSSFDYAYSCRVPAPPDTTVWASTGFPSSPGTIHVPLSCDFSGLHSAGPASSQFAGHAAFRMSFAESNSEEMQFGGYVSFTYAPAAPPATLDLDHVELVQAVQDAQNGVPLVARKGTVVRVFPLVKNSNQNVEGVTGTLRGFKDGVEETTYSPLVPFNDPVVATVTPPDRTVQDASINFLLPVEWTLAGHWRFTVTLQAPGIPPTQLQAPQDPSLSFVFQKAPNWPIPLTVAYIPVCYQPPGQDQPTCPTDQIPFRTDFLNALYPIPDDGLWYAPLPVPSWLWRGALTNDADVRAFNGVLRQYYDLIEPANLWIYSGRVDQLVAWFPAIPDLDVLGCSDPAWKGGEGHVAFLQDTSQEDFLDASQSIAHEIAHNLTLRHPVAVNDHGKPLYDAAGDLIPLPSTCGARDASDYNLGPFGWPYVDGLSPQIGFDPPKQVIVPSGRYDLMGYCSIPGYDTWISPYSFGALFHNAFTTPWSPKAGPAGAQRQDATAGADTLLVTGTAQADASGGTLLPGIRVTSSLPLTSSDPNGNHCLSFFGDQGKLAETCFTLPFIDIETEPIASDSFSLRMPYTPGTKRISLVHSGQELAFIQAGVNPPVIQIGAPGPNARIPAGPLTLQWTASDPDGDPLTFTVLYSADGGASFLPLATGITDQQYTVDATRIDGGKQVYLRVLASDGINGSSGTVGPIEVTQNPQMAASASSLAFDDVMLGRTRDLSITLSNGGNGPLHLSNLASDSPVFTVAAPRNPPMIPAGAGYQVTLRFRPDRAAARTGTLTLSSSDPGVADVKVLLSGAGVGAIQPDLRMALAALAFGSVAPGHTSDLSLTVHNAGPGVLNIKSLSIDNALFKVMSPAAPVAVAAYADQTIVVRFSPAAGAQSGNLTIASDDPNHPSLGVPLSGTGTGSVSAPVIGVSPATLDFGSVASGQTKDLTLTISNSGTASLTVSSASSSNSAFTVRPPAPPYSIAPGGQQTVTVRFAPTAAGAQTGTLTLASNDPAHASVTVGLTGTGGAATGSSDVVLKVDGGTFNVVTGYPTGTATAYFMNRLTPPSYPATLKNVQVYFSTRSTGLALNTPLTIVAASIPGGGSQLSLAGAQIDKVAATVTALDTYVSYAVAARTIASGDFFVGFVVQNPVGIYPADEDQATPSQGRSYTSSDGATFALLDSISANMAGNLAIRAVATAGSATGAGSIGISPGSLDFGTVNVGQNKSLAVTISNTGTGPLNVTAAIVAGPAFTWTGPGIPFTLTAGAQAVGAVWFAPTATGAQNGTLTIYSTDPAHPTTAVPLSGTGTTSTSTSGLPARPGGSVLDSSNPLSTSLAGLFLINEGHGTTDLNLADGQTASFAGASGPVWNTSDPSIVFNGGGSLNSYLNAGTDLAFDKLPVSKMTIVAKVFLNTLATVGICEKNDGNSIDSGFVFGWYFDGTMRFTVQRTTQDMRIYTAPGTVPAGRWMQVAVTWDGTVGGAASAHLFIDSVEQAKTTAQDGSGTMGYANATNQPFRIGNADFDIPGSFNGRMAYLAVYKGRLLTTTEMNQLDAHLPIR